MGSLKLALLNMIPAPMVIFFSRPYIAGASMQSALDLSDRLFKEKKILSTLDVLGEEVEDEVRAIEAKELYLKLIDSLGDRKNASISFKPGHMGYYVDQDFCRQNIEELVKTGYEKGIEVTIDMEDTDQTDFTLDIYRKMVEKYPGTGTVLQSRLWRTNEDIDQFDGIIATVRLCIGIYNVPDYVYSTKPAMKENLLALMKKLFDRGHVVQIATHDEAYVRRAVEYIEEWKIPKDRVEFQLLLGVPRGKMIKELQQKGYNVRFYVPFCEKWEDGVHYLRRRLNANPNFMFYVMRNILRGSI